MFDDYWEYVIIVLLGVLLGVTLLSLCVALVVCCFLRRKWLTAKQKNENPEDETRLLATHENKRQEATKEHEKEMAEAERKHNNELEEKTAEIREVHEKEVKELQRRHMQELEEIKTKHEEPINDKKKDYEKEAKASLRKKFREVTVSQKGLAHAENVMKDLKASNWDEKFETSILSGIRMEALDKFGENLVKCLNLKDNEQKMKVLTCLDKATFSASAESTITEIKFDVDKFTSLYGYLGTFTAADLTLTVAYAFHSLTFTVHLIETGGITPDNMTAIKNTYARHVALKNLKDEGVITEIIYCE